MFKNYFFEGLSFLRTKSCILIFVIINSLYIIRCSSPDKSNQLENTAPVKDTILNKVDSKKIDDFVDAEMKTGNIPGMSIAVVHQGSVIYKKVYGLSNLESSSFVTTQSVFKIASLTKPFTAVALCN